MSDGYILITGSSGLIGRELTNNTFKNERLILLDKNPPAEHVDSFFKVNLENKNEIDLFWAKIQDKHSKIKAIIHLAAYYDFSNQPNQSYASLQDGLQQLLVHFDRDCADNALFIFASSMAAINPTEPGHKQTAEQPKHDGWQYPLSKVKNEFILDSFVTNKRIVQMVLAGVYTDYCELVPLYNFIELVRGKSIEKFFYPGPSDRGLTYAHISDVGNAFRCALSRQEADDFSTQRCRFLIGEEKPLTYKQIHNMAAQAFFARKLPIIRVPKIFAYLGLIAIRSFKKIIGKRHFIHFWMIKYTGEHFEFDLSYTKLELQWQPSHHIEQKMSTILDHAIRNEKRWYKKNKSRPW